MKISAVYKITNTVTGDFYIGSSKDVKQRLAVHRCHSTWNRFPNKQLYQDMRKYGIDKFELEILAEAEAEQLKELEQQFIETLKPTYNDRNANGWDFERRKESHKKAQNKYNKSDKYKEAKKKYQKTEKGKEYHKKYDNQLCYYNGETLTLNALRKRFRRQGITNPVLEAKKYLIKKESKTPIESYDVYP